MRKWNLWGRQSELIRLLVDIELHFGFRILFLSRLLFINSSRLLFDIIIIRIRTRIFVRTGGFSCKEKKTQTLDESNNSNLECYTREHANNEHLRRHRFLGGNRRLTGRPLRKRAPTRNRSSHRLVRVAAVAAATACLLRIRSWNRAWVGSS